VYNYYSDLCYSSRHVLDTGFGVRREHVTEAAPPKVVWWSGLVSLFSPRSAVQRGPQPSTVACPSVAIFRHRRSLRIFAISYSPIRTCHTYLL